MIIKFAICFSFVTILKAQVLYDAYFGKPLSEDRNNTLTQLNATSQCIIAVRPCNKYEGRRVDGTCVNPRYPSRNGSPTPLLRMLPAKFGLGNTIRPMMNGSELPSTRLIRTKILSEGYHTDHHFNVLTTNFLLGLLGDTVDIRYVIRYVIVSECCIGNTPNRASPDCISIPVPADDPFLRRSGVRCMNLTRFQTFQDFQCIPNTLPAERLSIELPLPDLSPIYGKTEADSRRTRAFQNGLLISETKDGIERPPGTAPECLSNRRPIENACYQFGDTFNTNVVPGGVQIGLMLYREHNRIARKLGEINSCWDDEQLFDTTRQIHIAQWQYLVYYELMLLILGRQNLLEIGVIYNTNGYVNDFDERFKPGVFHEFALGYRYFHTIQEGRMDLYSNKGKYLGSRTAVDDILRPGIFEINNTEAHLTQGSFRQSTAQFDKNMDPDLAERVFGGYQRASDLSAIDINRGRDHGVAPYNAYRKLCGLPVAHKWEDFKEIRTDKIEQLRRLYGDVDEVELMPAIYSEEPMKGAFVGPTLFCIMTTTLLQWRKSDRHFFEHGDLPTSLTLPQLNEIRKTSTARLMCDSGVSVTSIQPQALLNADHHNKMVPCKKIPGINLEQWRDPKCHKEYHQNNDVTNPINGKEDWDWDYPEKDRSAYDYKI